MPRERKPVYLSQMRQEFAGYLQRIAVAHWQNQRCQQQNLDWASETITDIYNRTTVPATRSARSGLTVAKDGQYNAVGVAGRITRLGRRADACLRVCEIMGTGSGPAIQNPDDIDDWPVPVPIFSQTLSSLT